MTPQHTAALVALRALGRRLDRAVAARAGATDREIDEVLSQMKLVHAGIITSLHRTTA